ncbi:lysozyme family protein [Bradyrhizobium sp. F1.13.4]
MSDANAVARKAINGKATYQQIERLTGVPWYFAALCHYRESNFDFDTYLGNGETLHRATTIVPKGRGPFATFVDGAVDAFRIQNFIGAHDWGIGRILFRLEAFNGFGYHAKGCNSPYLYGGSTLYGPPEARAGKFVRDHVFDSNHVDSQLGTAVILHAMMSLDSSITLDGSPQFASRAEPEDDAASTIVLMQQALNKLGANPPLAEDGISGPKTRAAVSQFQQQNGLRDTGLLDGATVAALTRAAQSGPTGSTGDMSRIMKRLEDVAQLLRPPAGAVTPATTTSGNTLPATTDPISLFERLFSLVNKTAPMPGSSHPDQFRPRRSVEAGRRSARHLAQQGRQTRPRPGQWRARRYHRQDARRQEDCARHRRLTDHGVADFGDGEPQRRRYCRTARDARVGRAGPRPVRDADLPGAHGLGRARQDGEVGPRHRAAAQANDVACGRPSRRPPMAG